MIEASMSAPIRIRPPDRSAILSSLRAGVVPARGLQHFQVGRSREIKALVDDIDSVAAGGSSVRFVIGRYGAGKTFFLQLVRTIALEKKFVCLNADLTPDRRLHAGGGQARALYTELLANASTRTKPEGGAIGAIVESFATSAVQEATASGEEPGAVISRRLAELSELPGGYDFAQVVQHYWNAYESGEDELREAAVRWLRGEYATRTDARGQLPGVRTIIDDSNVYESLKLLARFVRLAGYAGLMVTLDEMVNLHRIGNAQARRSNYEQILHMLNSGLQGGAQGMAVVMSGTPEFLTDTRRGLYSYEALATRLAENSFATEDIIDVSGPVIRLDTLTPEDIYLLLTKLVAVHAAGRDEGEIVDDAAVRAFIAHCDEVIGTSYFQTPRNTIKTFIDLLSVLEQNPDLQWPGLLAGIGRPQISDNPASLGPDDELADFEL
jgi:hypothetical protein